MCSCQGQNRSKAVAVVGHVELAVSVVVNECGSCLGQILGPTARSSELENLVEVVFAGTTQNDSVRSLVHPRSLADASVLGEARSASLRSTASVGQTCSAIAMMSSRVILPFSSG